MSSVSCGVTSTAISERPAIVAGLSTKVVIDGRSAIGGPAIYASLGVRHAGISTALLTALGQGLTDDDDAITDFMDEASAPLSKRLARPMITWHGPAILGDSGRGMLSDDPRLWRAMPPAGYSLDGGTLILANGDPEWYQALLMTCMPSLIFMDTHMDWLPMRQKELNTCLKRAHVITMTENEYKALPSSARSGLTFGGHDKALIIKRGAQGVTIFAEHQRRDLPPPTPSVIRTDVSCGDLLLGLLAGHSIAMLSTDPSIALIDRLSQAYLESLNELTELIESDCPGVYLGHRVNQIRSKQYANGN